MRANPPRLTAKNSYSRYRVLLPHKRSLKMPAPIFMRTASEPARKRNLLNTRAKRKMNRRGRFRKMEAPKFMYRTRHNIRKVLREKGIYQITNKRGSIAPKRGSRLIVRGETVREGNNMINRYNRMPVNLLITRERKPQQVLFNNNRSPYQTIRVLVIKIR